MFFFFCKPCFNFSSIPFSSGEFHTFRLPVPSLWPDILEKVKAAGLNAISVYTHMGLINPAPGVVDFGGFRALQPLYDAAKKAGIWIVLRPGDFFLLWFSVNVDSIVFKGPVSFFLKTRYSRVKPINDSFLFKYINAETTAGGIAHWATSEVAGQLRTNATDWKAAWQDYIQGIINVTAPNQITAGGPVIGLFSQHHSHMVNFDLNFFFSPLAIQIGKFDWIGFQKISKPTPLSLV